MMTSPRLVAATVFSCLAAFACDAEPTVQDELRSSYSISLPSLNFGVCPTYLCGTNAGVAAALSFNIDGEESLDDLVLVEVLGPDNEDLDLELDGNVMWAITAEGDTLIDEDLIGTRFILRNSYTNEETTIYVDDLIDDAVESSRFPGFFYPAYELNFSEGGEGPEDRKPLCGETPWNEDDQTSSETSLALVIQGEAYNWWGEAIPDLDEGGDSWATIGCMGGAYAKKILMGYDTNNPPQLRPDHAQNVAMMQMLSARYCDRENHTITGVPVFWQDELEWFAPPEGLELEAIWTQEGAVCLNTPRYATREEVELDCGPIPTCEDFDPDDYILLSYNAD